MKQVGIIGCGKIGYPVIEAIQMGQAGDWLLGAVLTQNKRELGKLTTLTDVDEFLENKFDLVIDTASPTGLVEHGAKVLEQTDLWTVNAAALADSNLYDTLLMTGKRSGHRLRLLPGAIAGLDGVMTTSLDEDAQVLITVEVAPAPDGRKTLFKGNVREGAKLFPENVNVAATAGLAGCGLDKTQIEVIQPAPEEGRKLGLVAEGEYGRFEVIATPRILPDKHINTVAACIIVALRQEDKVIWTG